MSDHPITWGWGQLRRRGTPLAAHRGKSVRLGYEGSSTDEADALWLRAIGCELIGSAMVQMPALNRAALEALRGLMA